MIGLNVTGIWAVRRVSRRSSRSFGICLKFAFVSMLAVWLAGCGLPPALTIIATVADGISFAANGKSLSDVALSAMTEKDCAVYRIISNNEICREATGDQRPAKVIVTADTADTADDFAACFWAISAISRETRLRAPFCRDGKALLHVPETATVRLTAMHTEPES